MTDRLTADEGYTSVRAAAAARTEVLRELRFVGPSTADTLAEAGITAEDIRDQSVTFLQLVARDVDPGVAARLRREYSLPWSDEPARGARLRRRAGHIKHLRDEERAWIDASGADDRSPGAAASPDGSGRSADAEQAWRERSVASPATDVDASPEPAPADGRPSPGPADVSPLLDPTEHTVSELRAALDRVAEPAALAAVLDAERAGAARSTAIEAIERRLRAVGVDPETLPSDEPGRERTIPPVGLASLDERVDVPSTTHLREDVRSRYADSTVPDAVSDRLADLREGVRQAIASGATMRERSDARLRSLEAEDWHQLSIALLMGVVSYSVLAVLLAATTGLPGLPLYVVAAVAGAIGLPLRWWDVAGGDGLAVLAGLLGLLAVGLTAAGTAPAGLSVTLPVFAVVALAVLVSTALSRRGGLAERDR